MLFKSHFFNIFSFAIISFVNKASIGSDFSVEIDWVIVMGVSSKKFNLKEGE